MRIKSINLSWKVLAWLLISGLIMIFLPIREILNGVATIAMYGFSILGSKYALLITAIAGLVVCVVHFL
jgi:hypothetical protein